MHRSLEVSPVPFAPQENGRRPLLSGVTNLRTKAVPTPLSANILQPSLSKTRWDSFSPVCVRLLHTPVFRKWSAIF